MRHRVQRHQPSSRLKKNKTKKNYMISYYALLLLRFYFPAVYKIAEEPSIHQEQSKARAGACLLAVGLARRPDVPNRTRCLCRRASGQKKEQEEEEPPSSNTQDNCLVLLDEEEGKMEGRKRGTRCWPLGEMSGVTAKSECGSFITNTIHTPPP